MRSDTAYQKTYIIAEIKNCYLFKNNHIAETYLQDEWKAYQSGAEDNQCVVELPKEPAGKWGDRKYSVEQVIAVIKASGARIK